MQLDKLNIVNYKNIESADIDLSPGINCFVGLNGAGKTNVLDAIYYLSFCKSSFGLADSQNIRHDQPFFVIQGSYTVNNATEAIYCGCKRGQKKQFKRNKKEYQRLADHIGLLPLVVISPSDDNLIAESAEARRRYTDSVISQCDKTYMANLMSYNKLIVQRNVFLKQLAEQPTQNLTLLDTYDQQIAHYGTQISARRREFISWLQPIVNKFYAIVSAGREDVDIKYVTGLDRYDLYTGLVESRARDLALGYTSRGIHKDDIEFSMGQYQIKRIGSQGQRKCFVIALKLAQYHYLTEQKGMRPLLLLDDVFDKLDAQRGDNLISLVASEDFDQIFITDTNRLRLQAVLNKTTKDFKIFAVEQGNIILSN